MITCDHCGVAFEPNHHQIIRWKPGGGRFCSPRCAKATANSRRRQQRANEAPMPRPLECPCCCEPFTPTPNQWRMFCSSGCLVYCPTCTMLTWRQRRSRVRRRARAVAIAALMVEESSAFVMTPERVELLRRLRREASAAERDEEVPRWHSPLAWT